MKALASSLALLFIASVSMAQGLTIVSKATTTDGRTETTTSYIAADHVRWSTADGDMIIERKTGTMTNIDHRKKTYYITTKQDIEEMAAKIKEKMNSPEMQRAREAMKNLPPEQRKRMESMMGGMFTVNVEKTGGSRTIAGYKCDNWLVAVGQMSKTEECVTNDLKFPQEAWDVYRDLANSLKGLSASMGMTGANLSSMEEQFKKMKGFPLASRTTVSVMGRTSVSSTEVTDIKNGAIPASAWEVPAGYQKVDNPMMKSLERGR